MIRTVVVGVFAASLMAGVAPSAQAQGLGSLRNIFNCDRTGSNQTAGALIGGALGGLAGAGVARNDALGAIVGGALGAAAGSYIGCSMGGQDQASLEEATLRALNENRSTTWSNPQSGASARINVMADNPSYGSGASYGPRYGQPIDYRSLRFGTRVSTSGGFETVAPSQTATNRTFIRLSPSASAQSNGALERGQRFEALAKVSGQPWILVGQNGTALGYVPQASVQANESAPAAAQQISAQSLRLRRDVSWAAGYEVAASEFTVRSNGNLRASPSTQARTIGQLYRGDEVEVLAKVRGAPWYLIGERGEGIGYAHETLLDVQQQQQQPSYSPGYTQASADCRIVEQVITTREYTASQTTRLRACRATDGNWTFAQV